MCDHQVLRQIRLHNLCSVCNPAIEIPPLLVTLVKVIGGNGKIACFKRFSAVQNIPEGTQLAHRPTALK